MQFINVKNKEIKIKDQTLLVENEVSPETIQFIVAEADQITDVASLDFYIQFWRSNTDSGKDQLTKTYSDGILYLNWYPSAQSTNKKGITKIQIVGYKVSDSLYSVRWSTKICLIDIAENLNINIETPQVEPDFLANYFGGSNGDSN